MSSGLTLYVDPGEDTGWCLGTETNLVAGGTMPLWDFAHAVWGKLEGLPSDLNDDGFEISSEFDGQQYAPITRLVYEEFRLYPHVIYGPRGEPTHALDWDEFRTVQLIGALLFQFRLHDLEIKGQPAKIKKQALLAGAEEFFGRPLHENRHMNDAIQHWVFDRNGLVVPS
jgi:hypothetical protein